MIDIISRSFVGVSVQTQESGPLAVDTMKEVFGIRGIPQIVHADRGTSVTSKWSLSCSPINTTQDPIPAGGYPTTFLILKPGSRQ